MTTTTGARSVGRTAGCEPADPGSTPGPLTIPGQIVAVRRGAYARQLGQVVRAVHPGCILVKLTLSGAILPFGPSELK